jgi:AbrB family looped-hinge helix DNA binding protein
MSKVTSKLQVTLPKAIAEQFGIRPGDEIQWVAAGDSIRVLPPRQVIHAATARERLRLFDEATQRQAERQKKRRQKIRKAASPRGWTREDLYERARPR